MDKIRNLASYIYPLTVEKRRGDLNPYLEVVKFKGKYILNAQTVNYSFGGLEFVFERLFEKVEIQNLDFKRVLILGMGGGTIISLLRNKYHKRCSITTVEKDAVIIELARRYFGIEAYPDLSIIESDAFDYVSKTADTFDLIISDLFIESNVPDVFATPEYLKNLQRITHPQCCVIYNKMTGKSFHKKEFLELNKNFESCFQGTVIHKFNFYGSENSLLYYCTLPKVEMRSPASELIRTYGSEKDGMGILNPKAH